MAEQFYLTKSDMLLLRGVIEREQARINQVNTQNRVGDQGIDHQEIFTPEVYVAVTPNAVGTSSPGGIPAAQVDSVTPNVVPGSAICFIQRLLLGIAHDGPTPIYQQFSRTVYNLSDFAIPAGSLILVCRDKYGNWVAVSPPTGFTLTVRDVNAGVTYLGITEIYFNSLTNNQFVVTNPSLGVVQVVETPFNLTVDDNNPAGAKSFVNNAFLLDTVASGIYVESSVSTPPEISILPATGTQPGIVSLTTQVMGSGDKKFSGDVIMLALSTGAIRWPIGSGNDLMVGSVSGTLILGTDPPSGGFPPASNEIQIDNSQTYFAFSHAFSGSLDYPPIYVSTPTGKTITFSGTITLAALTAMGSQGSITVAAGLIVGYTAPT